MKVMTTTTVNEKECSPKNNAVLSAANDFLPWSIIRLRITPFILDPKVLLTLITHSLRTIYGELNAHEQVEVLECLPCDNCKEKLRGDKSNEAIIKTRTASLSYVAAALTMTSMPPFIVGKDFICIDIVEIQRERSCS